MRRSLFGLAAVSVAILITAWHAIYVSVIDIEHDKGSDIMNISVKVFTDDLQNAVRNHSDKFRKSSLPEFVELNQDLIEEYFNQKLIINVDGVKLSQTMVGYDIENDAVFVEFQAETLFGWSEINITAPYFTELFPDQSNILNVRHGQEKQYGRITKSSPQFTANFSD